VAQELGPPPWVVKDYVKAAKEEWQRACFVPDRADFDAFAAICERLLELRGEAFETGFVIKKYVELATLPGWTADRRRVTDEHRLVFCKGASWPMRPTSTWTRSSMTCASLPSSAVRRGYERGG
jgi:hypothetical protein